MNLVQPNSLPPDDLNGDACVPGGLFKHYEIKSCSNQSDLSQMFEGWDTTLRRKVAIKRIDTDQGGMDIDVLAKEVRQVAALKSAAFAKIHALEEGSGDLFLVMEFVVGVPLHEWLMARQAVANGALECIAQLAEAMHEAHAVGLAHGYLNPANLLVDGSGRLRILDLCLANHAQSHDLNPGGLGGGIAWMAPERLAGGKPDPAGDVHAMGAILYELVVGRGPMVARSGLALVSSQGIASADQWHWPETIAPALRQLILAMTARDPGQRPGSDQVAAQCRQLLSPEPQPVNLAALYANALQEPPARRSRKWHHAAMALVAGVVLSLAAWQARPYWPQIAKALMPYSESQEMQQGIRELTQNLYSPSQDKLDRASNHFTAVLAHSPEHAEAVGYMSVLYLYRYAAGKRDETWLQRAKASAQQAQKLDRNLAIGQVANAKILQWHHKLPLALEAVDHALAADPGNLFAWHIKVSILQDARRTDEAIRLADLGSRRFPQDRLLLDLMGGMYLTKNNFLAAEKASRMSLQRQPDSANAYGLLAMALEGQNRPDEALQAIQQGLQIRPNAQYLYAILGQAKFAHGDYAAAAAAYANAVSPDKGVSGSYLRWFELGEALMWVPGRASEGRAAYEKAHKLLDIRLTRSPDDEVLQVDMSRIHARAGDFVQAQALAQQAVKLAPEDPEILFCAGLTFELIGQRGMALDVINKANRLGLHSAKVARHPVLKALVLDPRYKN